MIRSLPKQETSFSRRSFIGGSDARIIMGADESALLRLWREKRGEAESEDLSGNLIVQLGVVTEHLNRRCTSTIPDRQSKMSSAG
jgi:predicted phage-related endonuclease